MKREASCSCGRPRPSRANRCASPCATALPASGAPEAHSGIRRGSPIAGLQVEGDFKEYVRYSDDEGEERRMSFCPECGSTVFYKVGSQPDVVAVPVGAFADPSFPPPTVSVYESRGHPWVQMPDGIDEEGG